MKTSQVVVCHCNTLQHTLQHKLQHTMQRTLPRTLQHTLQHTLQLQHIPSSVDESNKDVAGLDVFHVLQCVLQCVLQSELQCVLQCVLQRVLQCALQRVLYILLTPKPTQVQNEVSPDTHKEWLR